MLRSHYASKTYSILLNYSIFSEQFYSRKLHPYNCNVCNKHDNPILLHWDGVVLTKPNKLYWMTHPKL